MAGQQKETQELIGKHITITSSSNPTLVGKGGKVVLETRNTIITKETMFIKNAIRFKIRGGEEIDGRECIGNHASRIIGAKS